MSEFPLLSDLRVSHLWSAAHDDTTDRLAFQVLARAIESESRAPLLAEIERLNLSLLNNQEAWESLSDFRESQAAEIERLSAEVERLKADASQEPSSASNLGFAVAATLIQKLSGGSMNVVTSLRVMSASNEDEARGVAMRLNSEENPEHSVFQMLVSPIDAARAQGDTQ